MSKETVINQRNLSNETFGNSSIEQIEVNSDLFKIIIESTRDALIMIDQQGIICLWNPAAEQLFGWSKAEAIGKEVHHLIAPEYYRELAVEGMKNYQLTDRGYALGKILELKAEHKEGRQFPIELSLSAVNLPSGQGAVGVIREISERKRNEEIQAIILRLLQSSEQYSLDELLQATLAECENLTASEAGFYHFVGDDQQKILLQTWSINTLRHLCDIQEADTHYPLNSAGVWADSIRQKKGIIHNDYQTLEHKRGLPQGHAPIVREMVVPIVRNDLVVAVMGLANKSTDYCERDIKEITLIADLSWSIIERKRISEELLERTRELNCLYKIADLINREDILENIFQGIVDLIPEGFENVEKTCARIVYDNIREFKTINFQETTNKIILDIIYKDKAYGQLEVGFLDSCSTKKCRIFLDEEKRLLEIIVKRIVKVIEREQGIIQLEYAKKEAEQSNKAKSIFLANMSHEIRTPISAIVGFAQLLKNINTQKLDKQQQQQFIGNIITSTDRLLKLISDILDLSKVEAGELIICEQKYNLEQLLYNLYANYGIIAADKNIQFEIKQISQIPQELFGDDNRIMQILNNLIHNAVKFTEQGGVMMTVELRDNNLIFRVKDTGMGMTPEQLNNIFCEFYQADGSFNKKHQGAGLGLSISQKLAELMGGSINVDSCLGRGSIFEFIIPCKTAIKEEMIQDIQDIGVKIDIQKFKKIKILLVEDDYFVQMITQHVLSSKGHEVTAVGNGREAVNVFRSGGFDVILMDIQMPEMDGIEATKLIRAIDKNIPIIALTAFAMKGDREKFISEGMTDYISKPINNDLLLEKLVKSC